MLGNRFKRGKIDQTLFINNQKGDIFLVQFYVDDIIFGSRNKELYTAFEKLIKDKFQMSSMGELTFFLGLHVQQKEDGIFISQDKYVAEILKKFNYTDVKSASTLVDLEKPLVKDGDADDVDVHLYRSMIGSLMYLTASRPDIMFAVCACARFQVTPKTSHLLAVKRIFRYLKGKPTLDLWNSKDFPFEIDSYTNSDYAGATQDRKSTTGGCQFLGNRLISWQYKKQIVVATSTTEAEYVAAASCYLLTKGFDAGRHVKRGRDTKIPQSSGPPIKVGDEAVHKELGDRMERAATTASSLEAEQDSDAQTRFETTSKQSNDPPLSRVNTLGSGEDSLKLIELMAHCTTLSALVLDLEKAKDAQAKEIAGLKKRVQKLEKKKKSRTTGLKRLRKGGVSKDHDKDAEVSLVNEPRLEFGEKQEQSAKVDEREVSIGVEDSVAPIIPVTTAGEGVTATKIDEITTISAPTTTIDEINFAQTLIEIKVAKTKAVTMLLQQQKLQDPRARRVVVQGEPIAKAELYRRERLKGKKEEECNIALIESWENTQVMIEADDIAG
ncbi:uncharacterized mitochondrial protein-like protein [Tanacetum coccineum]